ncbi:hypothetical protein B0H21DRAFT_695519 [Amylocystis lapponica]|nr:hypothetical protein B0H21DRAFT_695519 [Amylocystis lapponica]
MDILLQVPELVLAPGGNLSSPVLEELGGIAWRAHRKHTGKTDNRLVKLSVCSKCKKIYYCSTECQRKNWPAHKDLADLNDRLAAMLLALPSDAQREKDFHAWLDVVDNAPLISVLNLHREAQRGRTHIVLQEVVYTPKASREVREKFRVLRELERIIRLNGGEGAEYVASVVDEMELATRGYGVPFVILSYGKSMQPWLGGGEFASCAWILEASLLTGTDAVPRKLLTERPYDPNWRKALNPHAPPVLIHLPDDKIEDAENDI